MSDKALQRWANLPDNLCKALSDVIAIDRGKAHRSTLYLPKDAGLQAQLLMAAHFARQNKQQFGSDAALRDSLPSHELWVYDTTRDETVEYLGLELNCEQIAPIFTAIGIGKDSSRYGIRNGFIAKDEHKNKTDAEHIVQCIESRARAAAAHAAAAEELGDHTQRFQQGRGRGGHRR